MTDLKLKRLLQNQLDIMLVLEALIYARLQSSNSELTAREAQAIMKLAKAQGATQAEIELLTR
jgi:hypothetical protein